MIIRICFFKLLIVVSPLFCDVALGQAPLTVVGTATPPSIVWGETSSISSAAAGGTAPYSYGFAPYCATDQPPTLIPHPTPNNNLWSYHGWRTGTVNIICEATDSASPNAIAQDTVSVTVREPNKFAVLNPTKTDTVTSDGQVVTMPEEEFKFEVRNDSTAVGAFAEGCQQIKIWPSTQNEGQATWSPLSCSQLIHYNLNWGPPIIEVAIGFNVPQNVWDNADDLTVVAFKHCRARINYLTCPLEMKHLNSCAYRIDFKKLSATRGQMSVTKVPEISGR